MVYSASSVKYCIDRAHTVTKFGLESPKLGKLSVILVGLEVEEGKKYHSVTSSSTRQNIKPKE